jgi:hypothetical protein
MYEKSGNDEHKKVMDKHYKLWKGEEVVTPEPEPVVLTNSFFDEEF